MKPRNRKKNQLINELENNPLIERACKKAGIARSTYYRWIESDYYFKVQAEQAQDRGREKFTDFAESKLMENINDNQYASIAYWLSHNTARYRPYPKNVYVDEIRHLKLAKQTYEGLVNMLRTKEGYDQLQRFIDNHESIENRESPLDKS